jgi:hypothetical protein
MKHFMFLLLTFSLTVGCNNYQDQKEIEIHEFKSSKLVGYRHYKVNVEDNLFYEIGKRK